jgi:aerobic C4-dicarboxylate transport protein
VAGMALILGIDRFMSEARAVVNMIGNGVAAVVMEKWEGELDYARMQAVLDGETLADAMSSGAGTELTDQESPIVLRVQA